MYDILLLGDYFFDIIYSGLPAFPSLGREVYSQAITSTGGAMFITACALRRLGVRVAWAGQFGNDPYSQFVRGLAADEGIDLTLARHMDRPYQRITTSMPFQGERAFVTYADAEPADWIDYWTGIVRSAAYRHLHLGGLLCQEYAEPLFQLARGRGATISMDCQDVPLLTQGCDWQALLSLVDIFMPNAREIRLVAKEDDLGAAIRKVSAWVPLVVTKDGENGVWIAHGGEIFHEPSIHAGDVIDTTGAGDCFNAGFLYGHIVAQTDLLNAGRYGNICGGLSVTGVGGATHAPTLAELERWLRQTT
ncbi:MAG: carbohydrate kinase family protein [bacterium]|nr:carbohydrate kinase family protein [bacterium]